MARTVHGPSDILDEKDFISHGAVSPSGDSKRRGSSAPEMQPDGILAGESYILVSIHCSMSNVKHFLSYGLGQFRRRVDCRQPFSRGQSAISRVWKASNQARSRYGFGR